jgi:hypothetical protein
MTPSVRGAKPKSTGHQASEGKQPIMNHAYPKLVGIFIEQIMSTWILTKEIWLSLGDEKNSLLTCNPVFLIASVRLPRYW